MYITLVRGAAEHILTWFADAALQCLNLVVALVPLLADILDSRPHAETTTSKGEKDERHVKQSAGKRHAAAAKDHPQENGDGKRETENTQAAIHLRGKQTQCVGKWDGCMERLFLNLVYHSHICRRQCQVRQVGHVDT